jgi:hypothetical protein
MSRATYKLLATRSIKESFDALQTFNLTGATFEERIIYSPAKIYRTSEAIKKKRASPPS